MLQIHSLCILERATMAGVGGDGALGRKSPGPRGPPSLASPKSWSSIASLNISKRNKTNSLEVRLENDEGKGCFLNNEEIERLLRRLNIQANQFTSVQACPERRNVVFITLANGIDVTKFITNSNESFVLKQGIRTTTIKPINKREVNVLVFGSTPTLKMKPSSATSSLTERSTTNSQSRMESTQECLDHLFLLVNEMVIAFTPWRSRGTSVAPTSSMEKRFPLDIQDRPKPATNATSRQISARARVWQKIAHPRRFSSRST